MSESITRPKLWQAILMIAVPVGIILYGTVVKQIMPPIVPLLMAVTAAALIALLSGVTWATIEKGMFSALSRSQIAVYILILVGALIGVWIHCGTIGMIVYWGLRLISAEWFLVAAFLVCTVASVVTGTSFGCLGTVGVALYGIGTALNYPPGLILGPIVGGAMLGDKMSPVSDSTNIAACNCETDLFAHIGSMMWTTLPAAVIACVIYACLGSSAGSTGESVTEGQTGLILETLKQHCNLSPLTLLPPVTLFLLARRKVPVIPTLMLSIFAGVAVALLDGANVDALIATATRGYVSQTGVPAVDNLLSRGGMISVLPTLLLFIASLSYGGILEASGVFAVLIERILRHALTLTRLVFATLAVAFCILLGTGNMMLASIMTGRAFADAYRQRDIHPKVLSRTCEDSATVLSILVPWSVPAFFVMGVLGVSAWEYAPYCYFNLLCPVFSLFYARTGFGIWRRDGAPLRTLRIRRSRTDA